MNALAGRIRLDFRSDEPIYAQIVRQVEDLVRQDVLKPGDQLPTVRELAIDLRINFSTVARAYRILDEKRLISTQRGRGTFIWEEPAGQAATNLAAPAPDGFALRQEVLDTLSRRFLSDAIRLGYTLEEVKRAVQEQIETWPGSDQNVGENQSRKSCTSD